MLFHKFYIDLSRIYEEQPEDFGKAVARYLMINMAGGGDSIRPSQRIITKESIIIPSKAQEKNHAAKDNHPGVGVRQDSKSD